MPEFVPAPDVSTPLPRFHRVAKRVPPGGEFTAIVRPFGSDDPLGGWIGLWEEKNFSVGLLMKGPHPEAIHLDEPSSPSYARQPVSFIRDGHSIRNHSHIDFDFHGHAVPEVKGIGLYLDDKLISWGRLEREKCPYAGCAGYEERIRIGAMSLVIGSRLSN